MSDRLTFQGFVSYANADAKAQFSVIDRLAEFLEEEVNARLTGATFEIWRDKSHIQIGEKWSDTIEDAIRNSHVFIAVLTPRWFDSTFCAKEFTLFEKMEEQVSAGQYIIPIIVRNVDSQVSFFDKDQQRIYSELSSRQTARVLITDFVSLPQTRTATLLDDIAEDIVGMITRLRELAARPAPQTPTLRPQIHRELDPNAQNFEHVDFIKSAEVVFEHAQDGNSGRVLAQVSFVERLYVQGTTAKIQFAVRRAFLSLSNRGQGEIRKADSLKSGTESAYYVTMHAAPDSLSVCIDPAPNQSSLADLSLPPDIGSNFLATVAIADPSVDPKDVSAELIVLLNSEGLSILDSRGRQMSAARREWIRAIAEVAAKKMLGSGRSITSDGYIRTTLPLKEKKR